MFPPLRRRQFLPASSAWNPWTRRTARPYLLTLRFCHDSKVTLILICCQDLASARITPYAVFAPRPRKEAPFFKVQLAREPGEAQRER